jgi:hypothetical protein
MPSWLMSQTSSLLSRALVKMLPNEAVVRKEHHAKWNLLKDLERPIKVTRSSFGYPRLRLDMIAIAWEGL